MNSNYSIRNFSNKILLDISFRIDNIDNIGGKSTLEIEKFINIIREYVNIISQNNDEKKLKSIKNQFFIQNKFSIYEIPIEILESKSVFKITDFLISNFAFYSELHTYIFQNALKVYQNQNLLDNYEIAEITNYSRERIRQLKKKIIIELLEKFSIINFFEDDFYKNYGIDIFSDCIRILDEDVNNINSQSNTNFTKEFITCLVASYLSNDYILIGDIEDVISNKEINQRASVNWKQLYVVKKSIIEKFQFMDFMDDVYNRINSKIDESYSFNFKSYLSRFINNFDLEIVELVFPIAEKIILEEFDLFLDVDDNIVFNRNTYKQSYEYALEALELLGKPSKVKVITEKILELHPNYDTEENKVRVSMKRKNGFVPLGRTSVFGLKKWEVEDENFKGGTIRSISIEYLENYDKPKHISKLAEFVLKFRPKTNEKSIYYNLKMDESNTFNFFKNSFIGLKSKDYSKNYETLKISKRSDKKSWNDHYHELLTFIKKNNTLPFYDSIDLEEKKLFRWLNNQKYSKKLSEEQSNLINQIIIKK
ncbi:helicase associated domain-containing protein [Empedobacter falsenii]